MNPMKHLARIFPTLLVLLCFGSASAIAGKDDDAEALNREFARSSLQVTGSNARVHTFQVWVADTEARRSRGLMFVKQMKADAGMLFVYPRAQRISMWMKNTDLSLDMVFVAANGRVLNVVSRTTPQSLDTIDSAGAALGVIELNAGTADRLGIRAGSQVIHAAFLPR